MTPVKIYERWLDIRKIKNSTSCYFCNKKIPMWSDFNPFCSPKCTDEYHIRSSLKFLREKTLKRDKGICKHCGINCIKAEKLIHILKKENDEMSIESLLKFWQFDGHRSYWEADHIDPVFKGGGQCGLENIQTLCIKCHKIKSKGERKK